MNLLILHQNFPGQFKLLASALSSRPGWRVVGLGQLGRGQEVIPGARYATYAFAGPPQRVIPQLQVFEEQVRRGEAVRLKLTELRAHGFSPDVVLAHPGWGEALFVHEVFPAAALVAYLEFFYGLASGDASFDPEFPPPASQRDTLKLRNLASLTAFAESAACLTPTAWQASLLPPPIRERTRVIHEGVDTDALAPDPAARLVLPDGRVLTRADPVVTYVSRSLEPYRGFHRLMRALPDLQARCPEVQVVIVGNDGVSYGRPPADAPSWRRKYLAELGGRLDLDRIHFLGTVPYAQFRAVLQVSAVHVYLTYPFILSWSLVEAMASGCAIVGSRTGPVEEVIAHGINGALVDFLDGAALVDAVAGLLADPLRRARYGEAARACARERFDFARVALPSYLEMLEGVRGPSP